jgi:hypothetical protein
MSSCDTTNAEGKFTTADPGISTSPTLKITDPDAGTPALEMRYINKWNGAVVIPAYEMNEVKVPDQHLNDTEVIAIADGINVKRDQLVEIGLMQGFITYTLPKEAVIKFVVDPRIWTLF